MFLRTALTICKYSHQLTPAQSSHIKYFIVNYFLFEICQLYHLEYESRTRLNSLVGVDQVLIFSLVGADRSPEDYTSNIIIKEGLVLLRNNPAVVR